MRLRDYTELWLETRTKVFNELSLPLSPTQSVTFGRMTNRSARSDFGSQNVNLNDLYPWSEMGYTGENKTIRVSKADGSNVGTTGGSDTVTLQRTNLAYCAD